MTELATARFARQRAGAIRQGMRDYLKTLALIKEAWDQRDWEALGYSDWQSYIDGEFGAARLGLPSDQRQKAVVELRLAGMSQRAIGTALGVSVATVNRDLSTVSDVTVEQPERITSLDGRDRPATRPQSPVPMPEPEPEAATGHDNPQSRAGEAHAGPGTQVSDPRPAPEAQAEFRGSAEAGDPTGPAVDFPPSPDRPGTVDRLAAADPDVQAHELRMRLRGRMESFYSGVVNLPAERLAEVADDELIDDLSRMRERLIEWTDAVFAVRRRGRMHAVKGA